MPATLRPRAPMKKALCIGIEYRELSENFPELQLHLPAAHLDPTIMAGVLQDHYGYPSENIQILTDAKGSNNQPTRDNIIASMHQLVKDAQPGDRLVFHFSGHGSQVLALPDHVEETDGWDEVIWPCDIQGYLDCEGTIQVVNYILDDDIKRILVDPLPAGVRLTILLDCCSSGTGADLPFSCGASEFASPVDSSAVIFTPPLQPRSPSLPIARPRSKSIVDVKYNVEAFVQTPKRRMTFQSLDEWSTDELDPSASPLVTSWAACLDNQGTLESTRGSVFLRALRESLKVKPQPTNAEMLNHITEWLHVNIPWRKLDQPPPKPQLGSNLNMNFIRQAIFEL